MDISEYSESFWSSHGNLLSVTKVGYSPPASTAPEQRRINCWNTAARFMSSLCQFLVRHFSPLCHCPGLLADQFVAPKIKLLLSSRQKYWTTKQSWFLFRPFTILGHTKITFFLALIGLAGLFSNIGKHGHFLCIAICTMTFTHGKLE